MGKQFLAKKTPKFAAENRPVAARGPRIAVSVEGHATPVWRISHIDWDGPWSPSKCREAGDREILKRLADFESMSWTQIQSGAGSHLVGAQGIIKKAHLRRRAGTWRWRKHGGRLAHTHAPRRGFGKMPNPAGRMPAAPRGPASCPGHGGVGILQPG